MRGKRLKASGFHALRSKEKFFTEIMDLSNSFDKTRREFSTQIWRKKKSIEWSCLYIPSKSLENCSADCCQRLKLDLMRNILIT